MSLQLRRPPLLSLVLSLLIIVMIIDTQRGNVWWTALVDSVRPESGVALPHTTDPWVLHAIIVLLIVARPWIHRRDAQTRGHAAIILLVMLFVTMVFAETVSIRVSLAIVVLALAFLLYTLHLQHVRDETEQRTVDAIERLATEDASRHEIDESPPSRA